MNSTRERSRDSWRTTLPLRHSDQQQETHTLQAPKPGHENPGESVKLPRRVWYKSQVASQEGHKCQTQKAGGLEQYKKHDQQVMEV